MYWKCHKINPSQKDDWKKIDKNNVTIALNVLHPKKEKCILRMFQNMTQIVKNNLSASLGGITSKNNGEFYCLNCLHSFRTKNKLKSHKRVCEDKDFCNVIMPSADIEILEFNPYQKSDKESFIIYADIECIIERLMDGKIIFKIHLKQK